jgi:flavin-dependent dehydrogenase
VKRFDADIIVVGGGPAGATIANRLATMSYDVLVIEAAEFPRPHVGESIHSQIVSLLEPLGVLEEMQSAEFLRPKGALVHWAGDTRYRPESAPGFQVDRGRFDAILLQGAVRSGARIIQPGRVHELGHVCRGEWELTVVDRHKRLRLRSRFVVDAAGRRGCLPGKRLRLQPPTIALYAYWRDTGLVGQETRIEAGGDQWYWAAPLPDGSLIATVFVAPERCRRSNTVIKETYLKLLHESRLLSEYLKGRVPQIVQTCSAAASRIAEPVHNDWIKIGEAVVSKARRS